MAQEGKRRWGATRMAGQGQESGGRATTGPDGVRPRAWPRYFFGSTIVAFFTLSSFENSLSR